MPAILTAKCANHTNGHTNTATDTVTEQLKSFCFLRNDFLQFILRIWISSRLYF